ncbi:MAG: hypothetical protein R6W72_07430 [Desulfurivibrionaceae bacterium]
MASQKVASSRIAANCLVISSGLKYASFLEMRALDLTIFTREGHCSLAIPFLYPQGISFVRAGKLLYSALTFCELINNDEFAKTDLPRHCEGQSDEAIQYFQLVTCFWIASLRSQ